MDTSKEYIKMCEKAEELNYSPSGTDGNWYYYSEENMIRCRNSYEGDFGDVWLPRQDQLQEMISKDFGNCKWYDVLESLINYYQSGDFELITSMEQLWLAFVMKEKYQKTWDGKEWRKEDDE